MSIGGSSATRDCKEGGEDDTDEELEEEKLRSEDEAVCANGIVSEPRAC
jgi:hypothetical protein